MKSSVFAILLLVAGAFAFPKVDDSSRLSGAVEDRIETGIKRLSALIRLLGLDPLEIVESETVFAPLPGIFEGRVFGNDISFSGGSNIAINYLDYNVLLSRLRFEFSLPELVLNIGNAGVDIILLDNIDSVRLSGSLAVRGITLGGEIGFNLDWDGVSVRTITIDMRFGRTESNLTLVALNKDLSEFLNTLLGVQIPDSLERFGVRN
ncbi:unnamed protein product, partial [Brenthis ino]